VIASSAGYPDSQPRASVPFAIFSTAGTEDFNYMEMGLLDCKLTSPHFLAVFQGGHTLPPDDVAFDALEWMDVQAMQSRRRSRDDALVTRIVEKRRTRLAAADGPAETVYLLTALVSDFKGLAEVSAEAARLEQLSRQAEVKKALQRERDTVSAEGRMLEEIFGLEARLGSDDGREVSLMMLRDRLSKLSRKATAETDTPERSQAVGYCVPSRRCTGPRPRSRVPDAARAVSIARTLTTGGVSKPAPSRASARASHANGARRRQRRA
jgi:hypothetical protein